MADPLVRPATSPVDNLVAQELYSEPFLSWRQWGAIMAGAVVGFGLTVLLATLGLAIGVSTVDTSAEALGVGSAIWWILSVSIVGAVSGWVVGYILKPATFGAKMVAAFLTWCVGTIILMVMLAAGAAAYLGGMTSYLSTTLEIRRGVAVGATWVLLASQIVAIMATLAGIAAGEQTRFRTPATSRAA